MWRWRLKEVARAPSARHARSLCLSVVTSTEGLAARLGSKAPAVLWALSTEQRDDLEAAPEVAWRLTRSQPPGEIDNAGARCRGPRSRLPRFHSLRGLLLLRG